MTHLSLSVSYCRISHKVRQNYTEGHTIWAQTLSLMLGHYVRLSLWDSYNRAHIVEHIPLNLSKLLVNLFSHLISTKF